MEESDDLAVFGEITPCVVITAGTFNDQKAKVCNNGPVTIRWCVDLACLYPGNVQAFKIYSSLTFWGAVVSKLRRCGEVLKFIARSIY